MMAGPFCNARMTILLIIFLIPAIIQTVDGYPYQWPKFFSYDDAKEFSPRKENPKETDETFTNDYEKESVVSSENIRYSESSLIHNGENDASPVVNKSQNEKRSKLDDDDYNEYEDYNIQEKARNDENYDDTDSKEEDVDDEITKLIKQAFEDSVFLTPQKWISTLVDEPFDVPTDEDLSTKIHKVRSPSNPPISYTQTEQYNTKDKIIFPDDEVNKKTDDIIKQPVPSCENTTFCVNPPYYPSDSEVEIALKLRYLDPVTEPPSISQRIGPMEDENGLCVSREQVIQPKTALDDNNQWQYVLNNAQYVQTVRVEICQTRDSACQIIDGIASGYKTSCKQKYIYRQMVALGADGTTSIPFQIPSSCCCHVKFTGDPLLRMAGFNKHKQSPATTNGNGN